VLQKCAAKNSPVHLAAGGKVNSSESSVHNESERWDLNLRHVYVHFLATVHPGDWASTYDREV